MLEKRLNAFRNDLADIRLKGQVEAKVFREGVLMQMVKSIATLHRAPSFEGAQETQVLFGEIVRVFDEDAGWAWVQLERDSYVGYVRREFLQTKAHSATHFVSELSTQIYQSPSIKVQPVSFLPLNSEVSVTALNGDFAELAGGGFVFARHLSTLSQRSTDFVSIAERFLHAPYYWGGKSAEGIDCSGLVQCALHACGQHSPRDADMQEKDLGATTDRENLNRGDLIFWAGHVGIMQDHENLLHASGHQMLVVSEKLSIVEARTLAKGTPIRSIKRF
jgi:cell wall-associated NlpC family hydrolase